MKISLVRFVIPSFCFLFFSLIFIAGIKAQKNTPESNNWPEWRGIYNSGAVAGGNSC